jgi:hypothetical protein
MVVVVVVVVVIRTTNIDNNSEGADKGIGSIMFGKSSN